MVPRSGMAISVCGKGWQSGFQRQGSSSPTNKGVDLCCFVCTYEGIRENSVEEKLQGEKQCGREAKGRMVKIQTYAEQGSGRKQLTFNYFGTLGVETFHCRANC